jgi:hypothetical protein
MAGIMPRMQGGSKGAGAVLLLAMLAGAAGGFVAGMFVADDTPSLPQPPPAAGAAAGLAPELSALTAEVAALRQQLQRTSPAGDAAASAAPQPLVPTTGVDLEPLIAALQQALAASAGTDAGGAQLVPPAPDPARHAGAAALLDLEDEVLRASHRLWAQQAVLDTYGVPDEIYVVDAKEKWVYRDDAGNGAVFELFRGHVVSMDRW